jgi:hypothetical protein
VQTTTYDRRERGLKIRFILPSTSFSASLTAIVSPGLLTLKTINQDGSYNHDETLAIKLRPALRHSVDRLRLQHCPVPVRQLRVLPPASSPLCIAAMQLHSANGSGHRSVEGLHLRDQRHAWHTVVDGRPSPAMTNGESGLSAAGMSQDLLPHVAKCIGFMMTCPQCTTRSLQALEPGGLEARLDWESQPAPQTRLIILQVNYCVMQSGDCSHEAQAKSVAGGRAACLQTIEAL